MNQAYPLRKAFPSIATRFQSAAAVALALLLGGCIAGDCDSSVLDEVRSPDGARIAAAFHWDCGATTKTAQLITLRASGRSFDGGDDPIVFSTTWGGKLHPVWKDARTLVIEHDAPAREIFIQETQLESVTISYLRKGGL